MSQFIHMGGHAAYVFTAYGVVAVGLALGLLAPWLRQRREWRRMARRRGVSP